MTAKYRPKRRLIAAVMLVASVGMLLGGCDGIMASITGAYRGPPPAREGISGEEVVIRRIGVAGSSPAYIIDRVRFVETGDPHNINRVARVVTTEATRAAADALHLQPGDRVILSTTFESITTESGTLSLPDWPGPGRPEYPIGVHSLTAIVRAGE